MKKEKINGWECSKIVIKTAKTNPKRSDLVKLDKFLTKNIVEHSKQRLKNGDT